MASLCVTNSLIHVSQTTLRRALAAGERYVCAIGSLADCNRKNEARLHTSIAQEGHWHTVLYPNISASDRC